jgi:signal transduction histidine kinase
VIGAASACADRLIQFVPNNQDALRELANLQDALARADHLTDALLGGGPGIELGLGSTDVNAFLKHEETALAQRLGPRMALKLRLDAVGAIVHATAREFEAMLSVLVEGSTRAMPEGGTLTISTSWVDQVRGGAPNEPLLARRFVRLSVSDTGAEPTRDVYRRITQPFAISRQTGLPDDSIVSRVRRLGGWVFVENLVHTGSRVHICLPLLDDLEARPLP